jgi:hypothetical protein
MKTTKPSAYAACEKLEIVDDTGFRELRIVQGGAHCVAIVPYGQDPDGAKGWAERIVSSLRKADEEQPK